MMLIWLAGPWHDWDLAVSTSIAAQISDVDNLEDITTFDRSTDEVEAVV